MWGKTCAALRELRRRTSTWAAANIEVAVVTTLMGITLALISGMRIFLSSWPWGVAQAMLFLGVAVFCAVAVMTSRKMFLCAVVDKQPTLVFPALYFPPNKSSSREGKSDTVWIGISSSRILTRQFLPDKDQTHTTVDLVLKARRVIKRPELGIDARHLYLPSRIASSVLGSRFSATLWAIMDSRVIACLQWKEGDDVEDFWERICLLCGGGSDQVFERRLQAVEVYGPLSWRLLNDPEGLRLVDDALPCRTRLAELLSVRASAVKVTAALAREAPDAGALFWSGGREGVGRTLRRGSQLGPWECLAAEMASARLPSSDDVTARQLLPVTAFIRAKAWGDEPELTGFPRRALHSESGPEAGVLTPYEGFSRAASALNHLCNARETFEEQVLLPWLLYEHPDPEGTRLADKLPTTALLANALGAWGLVAMLERHSGIGTMSGKGGGTSWIGLLAEGRVTAPNGLSVRELTNSEELTREGKRMYHCVGTYARRCSEAHSRIFSVERADGTPVSTVDVRMQSNGKDTPASMVVTANRAAGNHSPGKASEEAVEWLCARATHETKGTQDTDAVPLNGEVVRAMTVHNVRGTYGIRKGECVAVHMDRAMPAWREDDFLTDTWGRWRPFLGADRHSTVDAWLSDRSHPTAVRRALKACLTDRPHLVDPCDLRDLIQQLAEPVS